MPKKKIRRVRLGLPQPPDYHGLDVCFIDQQAKQKLQQAYLDVVLLLTSSPKSRCVIHRHAEQLHPCGHILSKAAYFEPPIADKLRVLWQAVDDALDAAYSYGLARGQNFIAGLAAGEVSLAELNQATITEKANETQ